MEWETVIGLETHVELATRTKIFCSCTTEFGGAANTHCCPVCTGMPGTLPVLNKKVLEYAACVSDGLVIAGAGSGEFSQAWAKVLERIDIPSISPSAGTARSPSR